MSGAGPRAQPGAARRRAWAETLDVVFVQRKPAGAQVSIERLFGEVRAALGPDIEAQTFVCPYSGGEGPGARLKNALAARGSVRDGAVYHVTGDVHYLAVGLPRDRFVLTVHDCAVLHNTSGWRREVIRKLWFEWPVRRAAVVTAISEGTRDDLRRWVSPDLHAKIRVVPNCVRSEFTAAAKPFDAEAPTFLQVGTGWNKNVERVAAALAGVPCRLEVVGQLSDAQRATLEATGVRFVELGRLSDEALVAAYRRCDALVFASLFEGFGLPIVEAQATGRPVITSDRGVMPRTAGAGALLVDPEDPASIRAAAEALIADGPRREALVAAGFENVARFTPAAVARQYEAIYREVAA